MYSTVTAGEKITVLTSSNDGPYREVVAGFTGYLAKQGIPGGYDIIALDSDAKKTGPAIKKIKTSGSRLIFAVGSLATDALIGEIEDVPIVACLVLRTDNLKEVSNATGVGLEFPFETQLEWLQRFMPEAMNIGVLYNPAENQPRIEAATRLAKQAGMRIVAQPVQSPQDVPAAMNHLAKRADIIWGIVDSLTLSPTLGKNVLLFSFRNNIPFIGPSAAWVKAGALYSLDWDYADMGAQCGEMAQKVLGGANPGMIPAAPPRKIQYTLNLFTARQMNIRLSNELIRGARQTY
jgi:putative ABC transport system substrate-binding protein